MRGFERFWGKSKLTRAEIRELYLLDASGVMKKITANADEINALSPHVIADDSITNAKLATDVKVGSLAALTTTVKTSLQAAINELVTSKYAKPGTGIPKGDLAAAVQLSLDKADTALQLGVGISRFAKKTIQLAGGTTPINFRNDAAPFIVGFAAPVDMSTPGNNGTIKLTYDSESEETATLNCAAGYHTGGSGAATTMVGQVDNKIKIALDGGAAVTATFDWTAGGGCDTGAKIATQMQTVIQALGAAWAAVTVAFSSDHFVITSSTLGTSSSIAVTRADDHDCCDDLDIGPDNGTSTQGTGDCANVKAVTPAEIATLVNGDMSRVEADASSGTLIISGAGIGRAHKVAAGAGTLNTLVGIPNGETGYGAQGMGLAADWDDALYDVLLTYKGAAAAGKDLAWSTPTTSGFLVTCETGSDTGYVSALVVG